MNVKRFPGIILIPILLGCCLPLPAAAVANLIRNGDMEQGEGNPANWGMWGWQMRNATFRLDTGNAYNGKRYATIINDANNDARFIQEVLVEEGRIYRISGWIKTVNVGRGDDVKGASISLLEDAVHSTRDIKGTNGKWEYVEFYLEIGQYVMKITISLGVGGSRKLNMGQASFDLVEMTEVKLVPQGAIFTKITGNPEDIPPTPPSKAIMPAETELARQPAPKRPWYSNPMIFIVGFLILVVIAAVFILLLSPKEENRFVPADEDKPPDDPPAD